MPISTSSSKSSELSSMKGMSSPRNFGSFLRATSLTSSSSSMKQVQEFAYLKRSYCISTPSCLVPKINELFKSICDRYDVAVINREKVDEALGLFKEVVGVSKMAPITESFRAWKDGLTNPTFTISTMSQSDNIKDIRVKADVIPKGRQKAQKHIRDLLDACNLYLRQKEFLQRNIIAEVAQLEKLSGQLKKLAKGAQLTVFEKSQLPKTYQMACKQFSEFPDILDMFYSHVFCLMKEISDSVQVLRHNRASTIF